MRGRGEGAGRRVVGIVTSSLGCGACLAEFAYMGSYEKMTKILRRCMGVCWS